MATDLGKAYVQIVPSAKGIGSSISKELGGASISAGHSAGLNIAGAIKTAIAAAGIGTFIKSSLEAGGNLQQSFGGLETLYGEAAQGAKDYAIAAAEAGISANTYAEQAVSFGAALKQAYGGDTMSAMEAANVAILDMADNSAKMGTDINSVQAAYQGFAKQNYTMLDNLKLGYGGTKTEMERLLADAEKLSGVKYDINNLGDVYSAIHVIQEDLGLTGVAAEEASSTFTGSLGAMKAAAENLMASLALGEDITPALETLGQTVNNFILNNLFPMVQNILSALPQLLAGLGDVALDIVYPLFESLATVLPELISGLTDVIIGGLNLVATNAEDIVQMGIDIVTSLVTAIVEAAPYLLEAAVALVGALIDAILNTDWLAIGTDLINSLNEGLQTASADIFGGEGNILQSLLDSITAKLPEVLNMGVEIITNLVNGILENLPQIITTAGELLTTFVGFVLDNLPTILDAGAQLLLNLVTGIINNLPQIVSAIAQVIAKLVASIATHLPTILSQGITILGKLAAGLIQAIPDLVAQIPQIIQAIVDAFGEFDWGSIGKNILSGIKEGILGAVDSVVEAAKSAGQAIWDSVTGFFKIESPSKLMFYAGEMIDAGLAKGINDNTKMVENAIDSLSNKAVANLSVATNYGAPAQSSSERDAQMDAVITMLGNYLPIIAEKQGIDFKQLYNGINRQMGWALS